MLFNAAAIVHNLQASTWCSQDTSKFPYLMKGLEGRSVETPALAACYGLLGSPRLHNMFFLRFSDSE